MRGLAAYLQQKRRSMRAAAEQRPDGDAWREQVEALCVADDATGVRKLRIREWQIISDSGPAFGGWGPGPSSPELLYGVLSTCLTHTYLIGAANLEIAIDRVQARVMAGNNDASLLGVTSSDPPMPFDLTAWIDIDAPEASRPRLDELHRYVAENCPLTRLIRAGAELRIVTEVRG